MTRPRKAPSLGLVGPVLALAIGMALLACGQPGPVGKPTAAESRGAAQPGAKPEAWDQLVAAARQEGMVRVLGPPGQEYRRIVVDEFQRAYPGITVDYNPGRISETWARMEAERATGRYLWDVNVGGGRSVPSVLKPANAVPPLKPALALPEVLDESAWLENRLWWFDAQEPYTTLSFQGNVQLIVAYNKTLVNPAQFTSYWDLLDPKWKGRMVATDVRPGIVGGVSSRFLYQHPSLGPEFLDRLFGDMDLTLRGDQLQLVD